MVPLAGLAKGSGERTPAATVIQVEPHIVVRGRTGEVERPCRAPDFPAILPRPPSPCQPRVRRAAKRPPTPRDGSAPRAGPGATAARCADLACRQVVCTAGGREHHHALQSVVTVAGRETVHLSNHQLAAVESVKTHDLPGERYAIVRAGREFAESAGQLRSRAASWKHARLIADPRRSRPAARRS